MASDLSAFHRVDDMRELDAVSFFRLVYRLPHYRGVMRGIAEATSRGESPRSPQPQQAPARAAAAGAQPATKAVVQSDPLMSQWIGFG